MPAERYLAGLAQYDDRLPEGLALQDRRVRRDVLLDLQVEVSRPRLDGISIDEHVEVIGGAGLRSLLGVLEDFPVRRLRELQEREHDLAAGPENAHALLEVEITFGVKQMGEHAKGAGHVGRILWLGNAQSPMEPEFVRGRLLLRV